MAEVTAEGAEGNGFPLLVAAIGIAAIAVLGLNRDKMTWLDLGAA